MCDDVTGIYEDDDDDDDDVDDDDDDDDVENAWSAVAAG